MADRSPLDSKTLKKSGSFFADYYPDSLSEISAVLMAHFESKENIVGSPGVAGGETMLREYLTEATSLLTTHGGTVTHSTGEALQACFRNARDAVKAAIALRHSIQAYNTEKNLQTRIQMKAGIDYGEIIRDTNDLHGSAVETAHLLSSVASPNEVCVSWQVFNISRDLPAVHFEIVHPWNKKTIPEGISIYRIVWDTSLEQGAYSYPILCLRPIWKLWDHGFVDIWENLIRTRDTIWGGEQDREEILNDKSIVLILKRIESIVPISQAVSTFLRKKIENSNTGLIPIQIIADIGPYGEGWKAETHGLPAHWETLNPGYLYISEHVYTPLEQITEIPDTAIHRSYSGQSFYQIALDTELPSQERKRFLYQKALNHGHFHPCFYCGARKHQPINCPSKNIPEKTTSLNQLGYLSIDELNNIFYHHIISKNGDKENEQNVNLLTEGSLDLAESAFFELKRIFQLRFLRSFWNTTHEEWNKVRKNRSQSEGGLIWLAQDSLRVSELTKAESLLSSAMDKTPLDYRVYVTSGFLHIDKNDFSKAEYYFSEACTIAKTHVQKAFSLLLLFRLYWIVGNLDKAYEKIQRIFSLNVDSLDAVYQDIVCKFFQGKERIACQRLSKLVQEDREYFVAAMIDPDLAPFSHTIGDTLGIILDRARQDAQSAMSDADNEYSLSKVALEKNDIADIQLLRTKIDQLSKKDGYFGYLDIIDYCNSIIATCRKSTIHRRREIWGIFRDLNKRLEKNTKFVESYPYTGMVRSYRQQLAHANEKIRFVQNIGPALSQEQLVACRNLNEELTREWDILESKLKGLHYFLQFCKGSLRFLRWSGVFMAIVWFLDLCLFPLIIYYLNAFLSGFDISTIPNVWFYQKNFLLFGSLVGISFSLAITIKSFLKN